MASGETGGKAGNWDEASLLPEALAQARRTRFTDLSFREPLRVLLRPLEQEAGLNQVGQASLRRRIVSLLVNRLRTEAYLERHPEIRTERIDAPYVIVGLPRTGTSLLHRLLSCDPQANAVAWWEDRNPAPFCDGPWDKSDPRIAHARAEIRTMLETVPSLANTHPWDAEGPDEEFMLLEHSFYTFYTTVPINMPSYAAWVAAHDERIAYRYLHLMLQLLQWQKRQAHTLGRRWVLKAPRHLHAPRGPWGGV
jgi:hypothetical protein